METVATGSPILYNPYISYKILQRDKEPMLIANAPVAHILNKCDSFQYRRESLEVKAIAKSILFSQV